ncbi:hypothetical protein R6Q59_016487 [Mikania micrantha]
MVRPAGYMPVSMEIRDTYERLEVHDHQLRQLQSEVNEIKTTLQSLEVERAESAKFRQIVLAWMKHQEHSEFQSELLQRFSGFAMPTPSAQLDSINDALIHVVGRKHVAISSVELQIPSEQVATLHQSELIHHSELITDSLGVADDTGCSNSVDRTLSLFPFHYQTSFGLLTGKGDGPLVLGQGEPKSVNTPTLMDRGLIVCSNKIHSVPFINSGSIPMEGSASIPRDRVVLYPSRLDWKGQRMASKLKQLQSKATLASEFLSKHGTAYYKQLLEQNKQYIQEPATVEKCNELSKQLFYTRLASLPNRNESFQKELNHVKDLWKNRKDLHVEQVGIAALFGLECFAWFCAGEIVGRGFTFTGYYV